MKFTHILNTIICLVAPAHSASLIVNWRMSTEDSTRTLDDSKHRPLSAGSSSPGDGALLELGFYSSGTVSDPFAGNWTVLSTSSIGDDGVEMPGRFSTSTILGEDALIDLTSSMPLSIRFYDGTSVGNSTRYNAVSKNNGAWNLTAPDDPAPVLFLEIEKGNGTVFEGGVFSHFETYRPIPEPGASLLMGISGLMLLARRTR